MSAMTAIHRQGKTLSDMLGQAQDLAILLGTISDSTELVRDTVESEAIRDTALTQQKKLQAECLRLAGWMFAKSKPRDGKQIIRLLAAR